jgi:hypothetical protein
VQAAHARLLANRGGQQGNSGDVCAGCVAAGAGRDLCLRHAPEH